MLNMEWKAAEMAITANRQTLGGEKKWFWANVRKSTKLTVRVNSFGCLLVAKDGKKQMDEAEQDLEVDVLENAKDMILAENALKAVGGVK